MSNTRAVNGAVIERGAGHLHYPLMGIGPSGHDVACDREAAEARREQVRLWYVAVTRARDMLVLPRFDLQLAQRAWMSLLDLKIQDLPAIAPVGDDAPYLPPVDLTENTQTREAFVAEAGIIAQATTRLTWKTPSRDEDAAAPVMATPALRIMLPSGGDGQDDPHRSRKSGAAANAAPCCTSCWRKS